MMEFSLLQDPSVHDHGSFSQLPVDEPRSRLRSYQAVSSKVIAYIMLPRALGDPLANTILDLRPSTAGMHWLG
jgi:hypothetical protein